MIKIQLDTNALASLFPPGTEAFLQLQQSCLTEVSRRAIRAMSRLELESLLKDMSFKMGKEIRDELIREFGPQYQTYRAGPSSVTLTENIKSAIKKEVEEEISKAIATQIEYYSVHTMKRKVDELAAKIISDKLNQIIEDELDDKIKEKLREKLRNLI